MFLRRLAVTNYTVFESAEFHLATTPDQPIVLITGNNGGGKTSTLAAFRLALHGRRSFDVPISEKDYQESILTRFHQGRFDRPCRLELDFDYVDLHRVRNVKLVREWRASKSRLTEVVSLELDGTHLNDAEADDLLFTIVPPEIARYFFFDAERIKELADWGTDDDRQLFEAVSDLLGIRLLDQLARDLGRVKDLGSAIDADSRNLEAQLETARSAELESRAALKEERMLTRRFRGQYDRSVVQLKRLGGLAAQELSSLREKLAALDAERDGLAEELRRAAHDILPLAAGHQLRSRLAIELGRRKSLEDRESVKQFLAENASLIESTLKARGVTATHRSLFLASLNEVVHGKPTPVSFFLPNLSRSEEAWMQRVIERELPELEGRARVVVQRLNALGIESERIRGAIRATPDGDPKVDAALHELETAQRELSEHEHRLASCQSAYAIAKTNLDALEKQERHQKIASFQQRRLLLRDELLTNALRAIPVLQDRLQSSKEKRFAEYLLVALRQLWNKQDRVSHINISFANRAIQLRNEDAVINAADLSSGEKQLFATAFIYALAKLSGRHIPFVIDTPLGRLDHSHRRRFVSNFLAEASHQTVLLSTDTEIVGDLYSSLKPLIAYHYDLSDFNGSVTEPVQLALG